MKKNLIKYPVLKTVILFLIFMILGGVSQWRQKSFGIFPIQTVEAKIKKAKKEKIYKKGQVVTVGKVDYTINSVTTATNVGGEFGDNASGTFLILNVTITNKGTKPLTISDNFFTLMKGKTTYSADSSAGVFANEDANFLYSELNPENSMSGNIVFDITPETASDSKLMVKVQTGVWGTQTAKIYVNQ